MRHLIEDGWDPRFVQEQVGHDHASTTSIYTCVSSDYRVHQAPPAVIAGMLGYCPTSVETIAAQAGVSWQRYAAGDHTRRS